MTPEGGSMPTEPLTSMEEAAVSLVTMYRLLRAAGMPLLAAACYLAATTRLSGEDPQQPS